MDSFRDIDPNHLSQHVVPLGETEIPKQVRQKTPVFGYCDSDFAARPEDRKSRSVFIFFFHLTPISVFSKLQSVVANSTVEAEIIAANEATREAEAIRSVLVDMGYAPGTIPILEDNSGAISLSSRGLGENRTKHIAVRYHYLVDRCKAGAVCLYKTPSKQNVADYLNKSLPLTQFAPIAGHVAVEMPRE